VAVEQCSEPCAHPHRNTGRTSIDKFGGLFT